MKRLTRILPAIITAVMVAGCATTTMQTYHAAGRETLCTTASGNLGIVAVLPEVAWRSDQKEPETRAAMAIEGISNAFRSFPCGKLAPPGGVRAFSNWSATPEWTVLEQLANEGVDTVVLLRIEELTPQLYLTFSLPLLWGGANEADFHIRALSVTDGAVLTDMRVRRYTGGPFNIRPASWSQKELAAALREIIGNGSSE